MSAFPPRVTASFGRCRDFAAAALGLFCLGTLAAPAGAGVITATGYSVPYNDIVSIDYSGTPLISNEQGLAGQILLQIQTSPSGPTVTVPVWCVDIFDYLYTPATYTTGALTVNGSTSPSGTLSTATLNEINALISNGDQLLANSPANPNQVSAAIQVAIWSVEYGALFSYSSSDSGLAALADQYIADVSGSSPVWLADPALYVAEITTPGGQGLVVNQSLAYDAAIPEPGALLLLATGLFGLHLFRRKRAAPPRLASA